MICVVMMFIINNYYGIKCLRNLLQLELCNVMFKVISDIIHVGMRCEIVVIANHFCNSNKMICAFMLIKLWNKMSQKSITVRTM